MKGKAHRKEVKSAATIRRHRAEEKGTVGKMEGKGRQKIAKKLGL